MDTLNSFTILPYYHITILPYYHITILPNYQSEGVCVSVYNSPPRVKVKEKENNQDTMYLNKNKKVRYSVKLWPL